MFSGDIDLPVNQVTKKREGIDRASLKKVTQLVGSSVNTKNVTHEHLPLSIFY